MGKALKVHMNWHLDSSLLSRPVHIQISLRMLRGFHSLLWWVSSDPSVRLVNSCSQSVRHVLMLKGNPKSALGAVASPRQLWCGTLPHEEQYH